ncbi:AAA family ATPase [Candidatus Halobeggiatoa sp. HSG11]|nr:AAA family ATPase [Candidatus Halobeggiatoa sp. HSG11]
MIKEINIENFRCFGTSTFSGFHQVNLIGGKNNVGKTAFLEALHLSHSPQVLTMMQMRGINQEILKAVPEKAWENLFFNQDQTAIVTVRAVNENNVANLLELFTPSKNDLLKIIFNSECVDEQQKLSDLLLHSRDAAFSVLNIVNHETGKHAIPLFSLIAHSEGVWTRTSKIPEYVNFKKIGFVSNLISVTNRSLAEQYDRCFMKGHADKVKDAFKIIDSSIVEVNTLSIGKPAIYLTKENGKTFPMSLYGNSISRIADIIFQLIDNQNGILLIDETESSIHYTKQKALWQMLFDLAVEFNVQIFATTHSSRMQQIFTEIANENGDVGGFFEFTRHIKTHQITSIKYNKGSLEYGK